jgi:hypothetical protein
MSYLKDREIWLSSVPTGNPPVGYFWVFVQNGVLVVRDSNGVDKIMASTAGSITTAATASYVQYSNVANKPTLVSGSAQVSFTGITNKPTLVSGSAQITYSGVSGKPAGIVSSSVQVKGYNVFATTGSNQFNGSQAITGSLTVTGQVVAQTLNVQQVTSSIVYSSGSNIFGNNSGNTHRFTGSLAVNGAGTFAGNLTINNTISSPGNLIETSGLNLYLRPASGYGVFIDTGNGLNLTGALSGSSATFAVAVGNSNTGLDLINSGSLGYGNSINFYQNSTKYGQILVESSVANTSEMSFKTVVGNTLATRLFISSTGAATFASSVTATSLIKSGGTSSQFLKADGSVDSTTYAPSNFYAIDYLVVAGAGGGGGAESSNGFGGGGAGGGAGGLLLSTAGITVGSSYAIIVGAGGSGGSSRSNVDGGGLPGTNGGFSKIFDTICIGGGQGQGEENSTSAASTGGSGGGRGGDSATNGGLGTVGQGNLGGDSAGRSGGGGGGANTAGGNAINGVSGGVGGNGITWFDGNVYACGGGGGGGAASTGTAAGGSSNVNGGLGSRSTGDASNNAGNGYAQPGAANTGTGGGGAGAGYAQGGQNGGSGIVLIRYAGAQRGTGGTITSSGGYTYHRFTTSGTFTA